MSDSASIKELVKSGAKFSPGYCFKCRQQEIKEHKTVLDFDFCDKYKIDYYDAHSQACEQADCKHPAWYLFG